MSQALQFTSDMKLGHYMKVPPRTMFSCQIVATILAATTQLGVQQWYASLFHQVEPNDDNPWAGCFPTFRISASRRRAISVSPPLCYFVQFLTIVPLVLFAPTQRSSLLPVSFGVSFFWLRLPHRLSAIPGVIGPKRQFSAGQIYQYVTCLVLFT
jgi:hypothetical protein